MYDLSAERTADERFLFDPYGGAHAPSKEQAHTDRERKQKEDDDEQSTVPDDDIIKQDPKKYQSGEKNGSQKIKGNAVQNAGEQFFRSGTSSGDSHQRDEQKHEEEY